MKRILILASLILTCVYGQTWERVIEEYVDNVYLQGAYSGGIMYSRPYWVDIDNDNDYDLFIGGEHGGLHFYRNIGNSSSASWMFIDEFYADIEVGNRSSQAFVDIDGDNDYDLFIGEQRGAIFYYRNEGTPAADSFVFITDAYEGIDVGSYSAPIFCDIDSDNDFDLFIGEHTGNINYYRNDGSATSPSWTFVTDTWFGIDVGTKNIPWFADIDGDNDYDLFIGFADGTTYFYRNDGTPYVPNMVYVTDNYISDVGDTDAPTFVDIDNDGDLDFFVGEYIGNINWWRNVGTPTNASWSFVRRNYLIIDVNASSTPVLVDIDADGDYDLFSGEWVGFIDFFRNTGTAGDHQWNIVSENYDGIDVGDNSTPAFVDIDSDNDFDLFIGNLEGAIHYYRNDGSATAPNFTFISGNYNGIDVGDRSAPTFVDIDNDNDYDLFIGNLIGTIWHYRNDGTASSPSWTYITDNYDGIDVGDQSIPTFADIDRDGDFDFFIGETFGSTFFYQNDGTPSIPSFTFITNEFAGINVEENTAPAFVDIDDDGDLDLFIGERWGGLNLYLQIPLDIVPPDAPYIYGQKSGADAHYYWHPVTDTAGNPENVHHYVVYRNTAPDFIPTPVDSIGAATAPDTTFTDTGALLDTSSYYYLVKAVDVALNRSQKSNMGYKLNRFFNENSGPVSDRNLTSIPWHSEYSIVSDVTNDLSPHGNPLTEITKLRDDQLYESWVYNDFFGWFGTNYAITPGHGYEFITKIDTTMTIVGSNNPQGEIQLNENTGSVSDRNWISIPYNAAYATVSDITDEYTPAGDPVIEITDLRDDQLYESWIYNDFFGWFGADFIITPGRGYEMIPIIDTCWNPTEFSNLFRHDNVSHHSRERWNIHLGTDRQSDRKPLWSYDGDAYRLDNHATQQHTYRIAGTSHIICAMLEYENLEKLVFTTYRVESPHDALTEDVIGCGTISAQSRSLLWFNVGNFITPWQDGEEIILIVEAVRNGENYVAAVRTHLNAGIDIQYVKGIRFLPVSEPIAHNNSVSWRPVQNENVIGYSLYDNDKRLNMSVIEDNCLTTNATRPALKLVFTGGHETVMNSGGTINRKTPVSYAFTLHPNPFGEFISMHYAIPHRTSLEINIYDAAGRAVNTIVARTADPGYYDAVWNGTDSRGLEVNAGIYFVTVETETLKEQYKIILVK